MLGMSRLKQVSGTDNAPFTYLRLSIIRLKCVNIRTWVAVSTPTQTQSRHRHAAALSVSTVVMCKAVLFSVLNH